MTVTHEVSNFLYALTDEFSRELNKIKLDRADKAMCLIAFSKAMNNVIENEKEKK